VEEGSWWRRGVGGELVELEEGAAGGSCWRRELRMELLDGEGSC
jgi:hypothetical protein